MVYDVVRRRLDDLMGERDQTALQVFTAKDAAGPGDSVLPGVLEALNTPSLLGERRAVLVRDAHLLLGDETAALVAWMQADSDEADLVLAVVGPKSHRLARAARTLVETGVGTRLEDRVRFVVDTLGAYGVRLGDPGERRVAQVIGDDVARVDALGRTLQAIFGSTEVGFEDIEPYLGAAGDVPEWDLTDALDAGDATKAIVVARRMLDSGSRVGLQIVNILQRYFLRLARLEGSGARNAEEAAAVLGIKAYPAGKALRSASRLGADRLGAALGMISRADEDLKGGVDYGRSGEGDVELTELAVVEVLVARLARLARR